MTVHFYCPFCKTIETTSLLDREDVQETVNDAQEVGNCELHLKHFNQCIRDLLQVLLL